MWFPNLFQIQMALFNNRIVGLVLRGMYFGKSSFGQGVKRKEMFLSYYYVLGKNPGVSERFALISFRTFHCWELKATSSGQAASSLYSSMIVWGSRVHTRSSCEDRECTPVHSVRIESAHLFIRLTWKCVGLATGQNVGTKSYSLLSSTLPVWSSLRFGNARFSSESIQRSLWTVWERASEVVSREQGLRLHKAGLAQKPYQVLTEPQFALPLKWGPPLMADVCLYPKKGWEGIEGTL